MEKKFAMPVDHGGELLDQLSLHIVEAAERNLSDYPELKAWVIDSYANPEGIKKRFLGWEKISDDDRLAIIEKIEGSLHDKILFIEGMEKAKEKNDSFQRLSLRLRINPVATDAEYKAGVYKDDLEKQVADAVFTLQAKGYETFQSGFGGKPERSQFMDVRDKGVIIPEIVTSDFSKANISLSVVESDDRTKITLIPAEGKLVDLNAWKMIWDSFVDKMPVNPNPLVGVSDVVNHKDFRDLQDKIRAGEDVYLGHGVAFIDGRSVDMSYDQFRDGYRS